MEALQAEKVAPFGEGDAFVATACALMSAVEAELAGHRVLASPAELVAGDQVAHSIPRAPAADTG